MKLQELAGAKRFNSTEGGGITDALDLLQAEFEAGRTSLRILGTGANGVALTNGTSVFKFWHRDSSYEKFVNFCHENNSPFLPKFTSKIKNLSPRVFYTATADEDGENIVKGVKYVKMELLKPYKGQGGCEVWADKNIQKAIGVDDPELDEYGVVNFMSYEDIWNCSGMSRTPRGALMELLSHHAFLNDHLEYEELVPYLEKMNREIIDMVGVLVKLHTVFGKEDRLDFGPRNMALRGDQVVILDPIVNDNDIIVNNMIMDLSKYRTPPKIQESTDTDAEREAVDEWIEAAYLDEPVMRKFLMKGLPSFGEKCYRAEFGSKAKKFKALPIGEDVDMSYKSASASMAALNNGVIEPNGGEHWLLELRIPSGLRCGRDIKHSDPEHPENVQEEFLIGPGVKFKIMKQLADRTILVAQNSMH
jgi:hypothetical protein